METIILISCVSTKLPYKEKAKDLYISPLFRFNLRYAKKLSPSKIFILSAKHGLISTDDEIEPYDITLNKMKIKDRHAWASKVLAQLGEHCDIHKDHFIFLAGEKYRQNLLPHLQSYEIPMLGLGIGKQLQFLKRQLADE